MLNVKFVSLLIELSAYLQLGEQLPKSCFDVKEARLLYSSKSQHTHTLRTSFLSEQPCLSLPDPYRKLNVLYACKNVALECNWFGNGFS